MTRGSAWRRTTRGYFVPSTIPDSTAQRILDVAPLIPPSGALAGWVAAYISGADVLDGLDPFTMARQPLPVHLGRDLGRAGLPHVRYVRERLPETDRQIRHGLPVTTPLRTAFDGARWAPNLVEAVVFLDQVAHAQRLDLAELDGWCTPGARWPRGKATSAGPVLCRPCQRQPLGDTAADLLSAGGPVAAAAGQQACIQSGRGSPRHRRSTRRGGRLGYRVRWPGSSTAPPAPGRQPAGGTAGDSESDCLSSRQS